MDSLLKLLEKAPPWLVTPLIILLFIAIAVAIGALVLGVIQGREVRFWPPGIGPKANSASTGSTTPQDQSLLGAIGLVRYNRDSHALDDVKAQSLRGAKDEIWFIGATMHYSLHNLKTLFSEKAQQGVVINVLIADPRGKDFESTARSFGQTRKELDSESKMTLTACRSLLTEIERIPNVRGCLNVKLLDRVFTSGVYFFDPKTDAATMILVPHITGRDAPVVPGFVVKRTGSGMLRDYFEIYNSVWNRAESFEIWLPRHSDYLAEEEQDQTVSGQQ